jgi:hypothetical protein
MIFDVIVRWDEEASVWTGCCDEVPAAADAPSIDDLMRQLTAITLDLLPDNHPDVDPASVELRIAL